MRLKIQHLMRTWRIQINEPKVNFVHGGNSVRRIILHELMLGSGSCHLGSKTSGRGKR